MSEKCKYIFFSYGTKIVTATIQLTDKQSYQIQGTIILNEPLIVARHAEIKNQDGKILNTPNTFDPGLSAYVIRDISVPATLTLDAQKVVTENL